MDAALIATFIVMAVLAAAGVALAAYWVMMRRRPGKGWSIYRTSFVTGIIYALAGAVMSFIFMAELKYFLFFIVAGVVLISLSLLSIGSWKSGQPQ